MTSLAFFRSSMRSQLVAGARLLPAQRAVSKVAGEKNTEKPLLDEDWKDLMMVDYGTGATSSVPPTAVEETRQTFESAELPVFQHWSSGLVREAEDPLL